MTTDWGAANTDTFCTLSLTLCALAEKYGIKASYRAAYPFARTGGRRNKSVAPPSYKSMRWKRPTLRSSKQLALIRSGSSQAVNSVRATAYEPLADEKNATAA